jgi:hypothetical protein
MGNQKPSAPNNFSATASSYKVAHLTWTAPTNPGGGIKNYVVTRTLGNTSTTFTITPPSATSYDDNTVVSNKIYKYKIQAVNNANLFSDFSVTISATTPAFDVKTVFIGNTTQKGKCLSCHLGVHPTEKEVIEKFRAADPKLTKENLLDILKGMSEEFKDLSKEEVDGIFKYLSDAAGTTTNSPQGPTVQSKIMTFNAPEPTANNMYDRIYQIFQQAPIYQDSKGVLQDRTLYKPGVLGGGCSLYDFCWPSNSSVPSPSWNLVRAGLILNVCSELISHKKFNVSTVLKTAGIVGAAVPTPDSNNIKTVYSHFFPGYSPSEAVVNSLLSISTETGTDKTEAWKNIFLPLCEWSAGGTQ